MVLAYSAKSISLEKEQAHIIISLSQSSVILEGTVDRAAFPKYA